MPKLKSHSGAKKRFNLTKNGKVKRAHAFKSHILTKKDTKRCRRLRSTTYADATTEATISPRRSACSRRAGWSAPTFPARPAQRSCRTARLLR